MLLAVSRSAPIGVDIQAIRPLHDRDGLAARIMHEAEWARFDRLDGKSRLSAFFALWARKEALLKAGGLGWSSDPRACIAGFGDSDGDVDFDVKRVRCRLWKLAAPLGYAASLCAPAGAVLIDGAHGARAAA
jgi:4'-phosphopantetheinyl transferase